MFRRSLLNRGHQLFKEPMGNEHNTFERGRRTFHNMTHEMNFHVGAGVVGLVVGLLALRQAGKAPVARVTAEGKLQQ